MKEYERTALIERIERDGATVGASIPDQLTVQGEEVSLRNRVIAVQSAGRVVPEEHAEIDDLVVALRRERLARRNRIEDDPELDRATAESLAESIIGIDRALAALANADRDEDIEAQMQAKEVEDQARWRAFVQQARGNDINRGVDR